VTSTTDTIDPLLEEDIKRARERQGLPPIGREFVVRASLSAGFVLAALAMLTLVGTDRHPDWWLYSAFAVAYALAARVAFDAGVGEVLPTELVLVPMLFTLPAGSVPLIVAGGLVLSALPEVRAGTVSPLRAALWPLANSIFSLGPALVFLLAHEPAADGRGFVVLAVALVAQFACDLAGSSTLERLAHGVRVRLLIRPLSTAFLIDALLAPVGFAAAIAARTNQAALLLPLPLLALLAYFARERRARMESILELSSAYRGTALLLGDVVDADDAYTGEHSRQVVDLVLAVCDRLGLDPRRRRIAEFAALLHDIGKIRVPASILHKPGPLTLEERAIMNMHTIEGERLLKRVGGLLGVVGAVVRSSHERWDGHGYPDGLAGGQIPLESRIVACCDAYSAMTTDRPYRAALSTQAARHELISNRGAQFDPHVVDALLATLGPAPSKSDIRSSPDRLPRAAALPL
jgi:HD-GYP domain-containing protein (c-di-GMP phosphodiesterase class II)